MSLLEPQSQTVVECNASHTGRGSIHEGVPSSGIWSKEVTVSHHINELEMLSRGECTSLLLPQNTRESCSGKMRQVNTRALSRIKGDQIFLTLRYGPENSQLVPSKQSDSSSFHLSMKREYNLIPDAFSRQKIYRTGTFIQTLPDDFLLSWSSTNRSICNKVVFSMPLLHDLGGNRYRGNSN